MTPPNPQPYSGGAGSWGTPNFRAPMSVRSGAGANTRGSGNAYKGPKGFFQWGFGQTGYVNPAGTIKWQAQKPADAKMIGWGQVQPYAAKSGQIAKRTDQFGMPASPAAAPAPFLDPAYFAEKARLTAERGMSQLDLKNQLAEMEAARRLQAGDLRSQWERGIDTLHSSLASRGLARSGIAGREVTEAEKQYERALEEMRQSVGVPAQERLRAKRQLIDSNLRTILQAQQALAKERAKAENEYRLASGLSPRSIEEKPAGFFQKGSTWFYRNPQGVVVSIAGDPEKLKAAARKKQQRGGK